MHMPRSTSYIAGWLDRTVMDGGHVYCSAEPSQRRKQLQARRTVDSDGLPARPREPRPDDGLDTAGCPSG